MRRGRSRVHNGSTLCAHANVAVINPYETVRKYECGDCDGVMMCACDEAFARRHRPHQIFDGKRLKTKERISVTLGFVDKICNACRGLPEPVTPMASIPGRTSKIQRYYWREIAMRTADRFAAWVESVGHAYDPDLRFERQQEYERIEAEVIGEIKAEHARAPKYQYQERSTDEVIKQFGVEVVRLDAVYVRPAVKGKTILSNGAAISVEEFVAQSIRNSGYQVCGLESTPIHVLFAVLMTPLLAAPSDSLVRPIWFAEKEPCDGEPSMISAFLPSDFGDVGYAARNGDAIDDYLSSLPATPEGLKSIFEGLFGESRPLREYLWAHRIDDAETALQLLDVLPPDRVLVLLRYLIEDYWGRFVGWPDLLCYRRDDYFLAEVKGSGDRLGEDQKTWIEGNATTLSLPFKLYKVHRVQEVELPASPDPSSSRER